MQLGIKILKHICCGLVKVITYLGYTAIALVALPWLLGALALTLPVYTFIFFKDWACDGESFEDAFDTWRYSVWSIITFDY